MYKPKKIINFLGPKNEAIFLEEKKMEEEFEGSNFLNDLNLKISTIEEKNKFLKERMLVLSNSFLKQEKRANQEILLIKEDIRELEEQIEKIKEAVQHLIRESEYFARKEELKVLERYMKIWEPLKFVKKEEVEEMINNKIKSRSKK